MYEFVRGPMMWISVIVCILGLIYQAYKLISITEKRENIPYSNKIKKVKLSDRLKNFFKSGWFIRTIRNCRLTIKGIVLGKQTFFTTLTSIFHVCIIITPIFLMGHNVLLFESWNVSLFAFSEFTTDIMTIVFIACAVLILLRRIFVARVRAVTSVYDYTVLLITIAPFVSGFIAYHQLIDYETIIIAHIICGELMLISIGVTKLGHMIFFFFVRFFVGSEYSFGSNRTWLMKS